MEDLRKLSDNDLAASLQQGNEQAFTEIYDRYFLLLYTHAFKWLRNREDTRDLVHELFLTLWEKRESVSLKDRLAPYLYASVRNKVFNLLERSRYSVKYAGDLEVYLQSGECVTDHLIREKMLIAVIEEGISEMPDKMREVFELSRKEQLSHKEIAEKLNISEETVKKHVHHALKILRPRLEMILIAWTLIHR